QGGGNQNGQSGQPGQMQQGQLGQQGGGGGPTYGGGNWNGGAWNGGNRNGVGWNGAWDPRNGPVRPEDFTNQYTQTLQSLRQLQQQTQGDPAMAQDLQALIRDMQRLNPNTYANDPLLAERIQAALIS